jgi:hypothetical protein
MIQNYDKLSRWNAKFGRIYTHLKFSYLLKNDEQRTCDLLGQLYIFLITSYKRCHSKILSYEKMKMIKKDSQSFCKVISLAPIYVLAPKNQSTKIWKTHHDIAKLEAQGEKLKILMVSQLWNKHSL